MKLYWTGVLTAAALVASPAFAQSQQNKLPSVKATIDSGVLVGQVEDGVNVFRGVPFAKPPIGALRWKAPQKLDKWPGERAAIGLGRIGEPVLL